MNDRDEEGLVALGAAFFAVIATVIAFIAWDQALDFDPCDNIFRKPCADCLGPGFAGFFAGAIIFVFGLAIAHGALRNGVTQYGRWLEPVLLGWLGLMIAVTGGAFAYAQWTLGI